MIKGFNMEDSGGRPPPPLYITRQPEEVLYFSTSLTTWPLRPTTAQIIVTVFMNKLQYE